MGVKAEIEKTKSRPGLEAEEIEGGLDLGEGADDDDDEPSESQDASKQGSNEWVEMTVEIPGYRDDDASTVFLAAMLSEALLADGEFVRRLWINRRFHWKLYLDVCLPALCLPLLMMC